MARLDPAAAVCTGKGDVYTHAKGDKDEYVCMECGCTDSGHCTFLTWRVAVLVDEEKFNEFRKRAPKSLGFTLPGRDLRGGTSE